MNTTNLNQLIQKLDSKLGQKGYFDLKYFWKYIDEKYFNDELTTSPSCLISKIFKNYDKSKYISIYNTYKYMF